MSIFGTSQTWRTSATVVLGLLLLLFAVSGVGSTHVCPAADTAIAWNPVGGSQQGQQPWGCQISSSISGGIVQYNIAGQATSCDCGLHASNYLTCQDLGKVPDAGSTAGCMPYGYRKSEPCSHTDCNYNATESHIERVADRVIDCEAQIKGQCRQICAWTSETNTGTISCQAPTPTPVPTRTPSPTSPSLPPNMPAPIPTQIPSQPTGPSASAGFPPARGMTSVSPTPMGSGQFR